MVQDRVYVDDDVVFLGGFDKLEEFCLRPILCTNPDVFGPRLKLSEVIDVVNVVADALQ